MENVDTLTIEELKDDVRPYRNDEIPDAMRRIIADPTLGNVVNTAFNETCLDSIKTKLRDVKTADDFREVFVRPLLERLLAKSSLHFTTNGAENINPSVGHLYVSNHRDIVLDSSLLQLLLVKAELETTEITFGSNLISSQFVADFGRSNKMYKILRGGVGRDLVRNSRLLSEHVHEVVSEGKGIWISQRDGRTKDGNDKTDQGLIKMLTMGSSKEPLNAIAELNIIPLAISYEYESCDALKAREIYLRRRGPYEKAPGEDLRSILQGINQYKGRIDIQACPQITPEEIYSLADTVSEGNDMLRKVAALIDKSIYDNYKLFPTNYIAYDIKEGSTMFADKEYSDSQRADFVEYLKKQTAQTTCDPDEIFDILLDIYANPVKNKLAL